MAGKRWRGALAVDIRQGGDEVVVLSGKSSFLAVGTCVGVKEGRFGKDIDYSTIIKSTP